MRERSLLALALFFLAACGGKPPTVARPAEKAQPVEYFHADPATAGTITGKIEYHGVKPPRRRIDMGSDQGCKTAAYDEPVITDKKGDLSDAFVYIKTGLEGKKFEAPAEPAVLDQHGCMYVPRVLGMRAGQTLRVTNSDGVSHNIHPIPNNNREWNQQQSPGSPELEHKFPRAEIMIPVKCNVHSWMRAYIGVVDHPYFAVTGADGAFQLRNVPPGTYSLSVWHEKLGELQQTVTVAASGSAAVNFTYP